LASDPTADVALVIAANQSCRALGMFDAAFWAEIAVSQRRFASAVKNILGTHPEKQVLPASADLLVRLGYRPPEKARALVDDARRAFAKAQGGGPGAARRIWDAQNQVEALRSEVCRLGRRAEEALAANGEVSRAVRRQLHAWLRKVKNAVGVILLATLPSMLNSELDSVVQVSEERIVDVRETVVDFTDAGLHAVSEIGFQILIGDQVLTLTDR
jgi:hypothetical protein